jgi:hypothetical protein
MCICSDGPMVVDFGASGKTPSVPGAVGSARASAGLQIIRGGIGGYKRFNGESESLHPFSPAFFF